MRISLSGSPAHATLELPASVGEALTVDYALPPTAAIEVFTWGGTVRRAIRKMTTTKGQQ